MNICTKINTFAGAVPITNNKYRLGTGPTVLQSVRCTGFEERLIECTSSDFGGSCSNHVGVECLEGKQNSFSMNYPPIMRINCKSARGRQTHSQYWRLINQVQVKDACTNWIPVSILRHNAFDCGALSRMSSRCINPNTIDPYWSGGWADHNDIHVGPARETICSQVVLKVKWD